MKLIFSLISFLLLLVGCAPHPRSGRGAATTPVGTGSATAFSGGSASATNTGPYTVIARGPHHRLWASVTWHTNRLGQFVARTNSFTELHTGISRQDALGGWADSDNSFSITPDGQAVAQGCQHQLTVSANINNPQGVIDLQTPDGNHLRSAIAGLNLFDPVSGNSLQIAAVRDTAGVQTASNQIVWPDAFQSLSADVRLKNEPDRFHQEVLLREKFSPQQITALGFDPQTVRLEIWTAFVAHPEATIRSKVIASETDPSLRESMAEPDVIDDSLDFGTMTLARGTAFGEPESIDSISVSKRWLQINGTTWLVESVKYADLLPLLQSLPIKTASIDLKAHPSELIASRSPPRRAAPSEHPRFEMARLSGQPPSHQPQVVVDYVLLNTSQTNDLTLQSDTTYFVSGPVNVSPSAKTIIEPGTVLKFTNSSSATLSAPGSIICPTNQWHMAVLTSQDDNSIGETLPGSTGSPINYNAATYLYTYQSNSFSNLRLCYAGTGIDDDVRCSVWDCQFVRCANGVYVSGRRDYVYAHNVLFSKCGTAILHGYLKAEHITADQIGTLLGDSSLLLNSAVTNSLFTAVTNMGLSFTTYSCATSSSPAGVFQSVGGGNYYLATDSPYRNAGTAAIDTNVLNDISARTTYPPILLQGLLPASGATLAPQVQRDLDQPDMGYHYPPLDYECAAAVAATNLSVTILPGTVVAIAGRTGGLGYGIGLHYGAQLSSLGTADNPVRLPAYNLVQESTPTNFARADYCMMGDIGGGDPSSLNCKFTYWYSPALDCHFTPSSCNLPINFRDCQFYGGRLESYYASVNFTNCLFYRVISDLESWTSDTFELRNSLFYGGSCSLYPAANITVEIKDNLFDRTVISSDVTGWASDYNAYVTNYTRLSPTGAHDIILTNTDYRAGPLGNYYYGPGLAPFLVNAGSVTNAGLVGLYHYTTITNLISGLQIKETNSIVDIGFHFVATDSHGRPIDSSSDGRADYLDDANGNGLVDSGELDWTVYNSPNGLVSGSALQVFTPLK